MNGGAVLPFIPLRPAVVQAAAAAGEHLGGIYSAAYRPAARQVELRRLAAAGRVEVALVDLR